MRSWNSGTEPPVLDPGRVVLEEGLQALGRPDGFRPALIEGIRGDHAVVLRPALQGRVERVDVSHIPEEVPLNVLFRSIDGDCTPFVGATGIDPKSDAPQHFEAPGVGRYGVVWRVAGDPHWPEIAESSPQIVEAADARGEEIIRLRRPPGRPCPPRIRRR